MTFTEAACRGECRAGPEPGSPTWAKAMERLHSRIIRVLLGKRASPKDSGQLSRLTYRCLPTKGCRTLNGTQVDKRTRTPAGQGPHDHPFRGAPPTGISLPARRSWSERGWAGDQERHEVLRTVAGAVEVRMVRVIDVPGHERRSEVLQRLPEKRLHRLCWHVVVPERLEVNRDRMPHCVLPEIEPA